MTDMKNKAKALIDLIFENIKQNQATDIQGFLDQFSLIENCDGAITAYKVTGLLDLEEAKLMETELDAFKRKNTDLLLSLSKSEEPFIFSSLKNKDQETGHDLYRTQSALHFDKSSTLGDGISGTTGLNKPLYELASQQVIKLFENINEELDGVIQILITMVSPLQEQSISSELIAKLKLTLKTILVQLDQNATLTDVANSLSTHDEEEMRTFGTKLLEYTSQSSFGKYFESNSTLDL